MNLELCKLSSFRIWLSKNFSFLHSLSVFAKLLFPGSGLPARRHPDVDVRRHHEPETLPHGGEVEVVHVVDILEGVGLVGADIGLVRLLGRDVQVVVLGDELFQLWLDVGDLGPGELKLVQGHVGLFQVSEEAELLGPEDHEGVALAALAPGGPAHPVDVLLGVVRRVVLHDPVHVRDIQPAGSHVRTQKDPGVSIAILQKLKLIIVEVESTQLIMNLETNFSVSQLNRTWKNVVVRLVCFCLPWIHMTGRSM